MFNGKEAVIARTISVPEEYKPPRSIEVIVYKKNNPISKLLAGLLHGRHKRHIWYCFHAVDEPGMGDLFEVTYGLDERVDIRDKVY